jgi:hypothetical protein
MSTMKNYFTPTFSSDTVSFFLPVALLLERTLRPLAVAILSRNPCLFFLFLFEGWYVLLVILIFIGGANLQLFFIPARARLFFRFYPILFTFAGTAISFQTIPI